MKITEEQKVKYMETNGIRCPVCESNNISSEDEEIDEEKFYQKVICFDCGIIWWDIYKLIDVQLEENE